MFGKIFSGYQLYQLIKNDRGFKDHLSPMVISDPDDGDRDGPCIVGNFLTN
jgi:hypothetical protein